METTLLDHRVRQNLEILYQQRTERLRPLTLEQVLSNVPHSFWAMQTTSAPEIISQLIEEYLAHFEGWWNGLLKDTSFCLQAIHLQPQIIAPRYEYENQFAYAQNRLTLDFINRFCKPDYGIDWEKLLRFNSGAD